MKQKLISLLLCGAFVSLAAPAHAILYTGSSGNLAASVDFSINGGNLQVTLTNTSSADVLVPSDVLTAVFFDIGGVGSLFPVSALLNSGSSVFYDPDGQPAGGNVGGEWAYGSGLGGAPGGATEGISSSGFGLFGSANFNGPDLEPPPAVDGVQYGLLSAGDNPGTGNGGITGSGGLIKNSVIFSLSGLPTGFILSTDNISHVSFQYGTSLSEANFPGDTNGGGGGGGNNGVPEPGTLSLLGLSLVGLATGRRRRAG